MAASEPFQSYVFIDEIVVKPTFMRLRDKAGRGQRLTMDAPFRSRRSQTLIAGLTQDALVAPRVMKEAMDGPVFTAEIREVCVKELKPGTGVILGNLATHRNKQAAQAL